MSQAKKDRRDFLKTTAASAAGITASSLLPRRARAEGGRIRFAAIGMNHGHISGQTRAMLRAGAELVSFYAKEPELAANYSKQFPQAKQARSEAEILEDKSIHLVVSASIPNERAPLGVRVMRHGKDFMVDKPGVTSLAQLAEARRVQRETKRIYSIMYSERFENPATVRRANWSRPAPSAKSSRPSASVRIESIRRRDRPGSGTGNISAASFATSRRTRSINFSSSPILRRPKWSRRKSAT